MIGGQPMMMQPQFVPMQTYPGPQAVPVQVPQAWPPKSQNAPPPQAKVQPATLVPPGAVAQQPASQVPPGTVAQQPVLPAYVRGARPEDPPPPPATSIAKMSPLSLPSPEELGVASTAAPAKVDWNAARDRLGQLGGVGLQMSQLTDGSYRVAFMMRTRQADQFQHIEATARTEAEAVSAALTRAEQWATTNR
jgi:hypothetical protein